MRVRVEVAEVEGATRVRLEQTGCRTDDEGRARDHLNCRSCWIYFLMNLQSVLEHGNDLRDPARGDRNDSISVFFEATE